ncbi:DUF3152 domain-containing protein [Catenuloplanes atrovinosus]|uniref:DUF3152 domain-containing protein n=1 Tax=Catenuloplanes atrovinosus TaxID=137266 RepID=A0AAE4CGL2_9ACTN|nr:DUF3152 domain-containing protein [Catenuloplanes atrovinosus]MDR7280815.1 hypothetical protein [Catenuloplanes atrovinosus]
MWRKTLVAALCAISVTGCGTVAPAPGSPRSAPPLPVAMTAAPTPAPSELDAPPEITFPGDGPGTWRIAAGPGDTAGRSGTLLRYRIAVEDGIEGVSPDEFADEVADVLGDDRSWITGGQWRLRRAAPGEHPDFTIFLATPGTRDELCQMGTDRYTSCRNGDRVVLNVARWAGGVPHWRGPLPEYRAYLINHEVGHRLHQGHELCPEPGGPAPVMQQQTLALHGCTPNGWPYPNGHDRLAGPSGAYDDPLPTS